MRYLLIILIILQVASAEVLYEDALSVRKSLTGRTKLFERDYVKLHCKHFVSIVDSSLSYEIEKLNSDNTRTDCYTVNHSIEYDFIGKWYECVGQSLHYARLNDNDAVCALISTDDDWKKYRDTIFETIRYHQLNVQIIYVKL